MRRILLLIFFLLYNFSSVAQTCDSLNQVVIPSSTCGHIPLPGHNQSWNEGNGCDCLDCFCFTAIVREVSYDCFVQRLTIIGSKKVKIGKIWVDPKFSRELSEGRNFEYTYVHFEFIPKNKKRAIRRLAKYKSLGYDFFIINKHTKEVYFRGTL